MTSFSSDFLQIMQERGFIYQSSDLEGLDKHLLSGKPITAYHGADPTGDSLHVGHMVPVMMMRWLQKCGHKILMLTGGMTALVGDPSFKSAERPLLEIDEINQNIEHLKACFEKYVALDGKQGQLVNNYDWFQGMNIIEFLRDIGKVFSVNQMMTLESMKLRLGREQHLSFLEFSYPLIQAYDFYALAKDHDCTLQLGGADQWGNMVGGIDYVRRKLSKQVFVLSCPLITTADGKKMGKTEAGAVWLRKEKLSEYDFYQYWRNVTDADVGKFLKLFTELQMDEIAKLEKLEGQEINEAKKILALEATALCHGRDAAEQAAKTAQQTFEQGMTSAGLPTFDVKAGDLEAGINILDAFVTVGLAGSKGEARRLIQGGGAKINDVAVKDDKQVLTNDDLNDGSIKLSAGKKKHGVLKI